MWVCRSLGKTLSGLGPDIGASSHEYSSAQRLPENLVPPKSLDYTFVNIINSHKCGPRVGDGL